MNDLKNAKLKKLLSQASDELARLEEHLNDMIELMQAHKNGE